MAISEIGLDFEALQNLTELNITLPSSSNFINEAVDSAHVLTNNNVAYLIMAGLLIVFFVTFSDKNPLLDFKYDNFRSYALSFGFSSLIGLTMVEIGYLREFKVIASMIIVFASLFSYIVFYEDKGDL